MGWNEHATAELVMETPRKQLRKQARRTFLATDTGEKPVNENNWRRAEESVDVLEDKLTCACHLVPSVRGRQRIRCEWAGRVCKKAATGKGGKYAM